MQTGRLSRAVRTAETAKMALAPDPFMRGPNRYRDLSAAELDQGNGGADAARSHEVDQWLANECAAADARSRCCFSGPTQGSTRFSRTPALSTIPCAVGAGAGGLGLRWRSDV